MASVSPRSSSHGDHGASRPNACLNCRKQRLYCTKSKPACSRCFKNGLPCTYEETRKVTINESKLHALQAKANAYDALLNQSQNLDRIQCSAENSGDDFEDGQPLLEPFNQLSLVRTSSSFKGPGSSDTFLRNLRKLSGLYGDDTALDTQSNLYEPNAIASRRIFSRVPLPPPEIANRLFAAQYTYIGTIFAFTNPTDNFKQLLKEAYFGSPDPGNQEACLRYAKVLVVLALGQLYSVNQWVNFRGPPGFEYFSDALGLLPDPHERGSILSVETLALVGYFFQNMNQPSAASMYIGMALRMAKSLGLHQEVSDFMEDPSREHRRRVWWSVYSLDRILSIKSGNPITIQDEDIGVELPSQLTGELDKWSVTVLCHYTQLSRILGEIHATIYRKTGSNVPRTSGKRLMESVQGIMMTLSKWNRKLPEELLFNPAKLSISRESVSTFAHYYQCINMTVRPLLSHIVQQRLKRIRSGAETEVKESDWKTDLSPSTINVIEICISGAQDVIAMMRIAAEKDLVATYGYMDGEHVVSATIVLVMVCVAFPSTPDSTAAMHAGLKLLRDMGERGNSHMAARYKLLRSVLEAEGVGAVSDPIGSDAEGVTVGGSGPNTTPRAGHAEAPAHAIDATLGTSGQKQGDHSFASQHGAINLAGTWTMPTFPALDYNFLDEAMIDENIMTGMDYTLWEESFTNPTMDAGLCFYQPAEVAYLAPRMDEVT